MDLNTVLNHIHRQPEKPRLSEQESKKLLEVSKAEADEVLKSLGSSLEGLSAAEARRRVETFGLNRIVEEKRKTPVSRFFGAFKDPLSMLLLGLAAVSYLTRDIEATIIISVMVFIGVCLRVFQELRADSAAEKLKAMVRTTATVIRGGVVKETPLRYVVPGDLIHLSAGDMVPADIRIVSSKDLYVNQATITGESLPAEKHATKETRDVKNPLELVNVCFMGTNVVSGTATAVAVSTAGDTYLGALAKSVVSQKVETSFDRGINSFTWLMIKFIVVMVPLVFMINGLSKGDWLEAFLFALAVAVGLTPEMLPMIVTVNLAEGALQLSKKKVIVKRLNSIQNFGAMNILCTDKTGTLTQGKVVLEKHMDIHGNESVEVLKYAFLNSFHQTSLKNILDIAVLNHAELHSELKAGGGYKKVDEVPFDFVRRRMSVVVGDSQGRHILICKGAVEEVLSVCTKSRRAGAEHGEHFPIEALHRENAKKLVRGLNEEGFRVIAVAYKETPSTQKVYDLKDESNLVLIGFTAFLDPPKESALRAIGRLRQNGVEVKVLTGDNEVVTKKVCRDVGLPFERILLGSQIDEMSEERLAEAAEKTTVFAKLSPSHKERVIRALQKRGHVVGFMGDGINDAPALRSADVGISVDTAVDIAKESSSIILLEKSLRVLEEGVLEGRKIFGNIIKYVKMAASSNFGNMFSVVGGSVFLPFLPMKPIQVLVNNLLYDMSQITIPTDEVDKEWLAKPRKWAIDEIKRFILFIGPISSLFDYLTYFAMLFVFDCWNNPDLFHTGWFVESLLTQTLIIHVIRTNKIPFIQSRASLPLILTTIGIMSVGMVLPYTPLAKHLGFVPLPPLYWVFIALTLACYLALTQVVKSWFVRKYAID